MKYPKVSLYEFENFQHSHVYHDYEEILDRMSMNRE